MKDTLKVGLTGNRFSGKTRVSKVFKQISIPIFDADVVLAFIINHDVVTINMISKQIGSHIFTKCDTTGSNSSIDIKKVTKKDFDKILDFAEYELLTAWKRFLHKNEKSLYVIFKSSLLFERKWCDMMDFNINVFCPKITRMERCREVTKMGVIQIGEYLADEMDEFSKNKASNFVIHNYGLSLSDGSILDQVNNIDNKIISSFFEATNVNLSIDNSKPKNEKK